MFCGSGSGARSGSRRTWSVPVSVSCAESRSEKVGSVVIKHEACQIRRKGRADPGARIGCGRCARAKIGNEKGWNVTSSVILEGVQSQIGRASCRERVCPYVEIWVVAGPIKK